VSRRGDRAAADRLIREYGIRASSADAPVESLSGGNQQKVVLAKWLSTSPRVIVLDEPTRGVDVGAKAEIYRLMAELKRQGAAIVMTSSELPELLGMCDQILVLCEGRISARLPVAEASEEVIMRYATGVSAQAAHA
jgi:ABC-type sugar transport system ATPase subunit